MPWQLAACRAAVQRVAVCPLGFCYDAQWWPALWLQVSNPF